MLQKLLPDAKLEDEAMKDDELDDDMNDIIETKPKLSISPDSLEIDKSGPIDTSVGNLELNRDEHGNFDFRGNSSGSVFLQSLMTHIGSPKGSTATRIEQDVYAGASTPKNKQDRSGSGTSGEDGKVEPSPTELSSAASGKYPLSPDLPDVDEEIQLPTLEVAIGLSRLCLDRGCGILQFTHTPSHFARLAKFYDPKEPSKDEEFLPVLYSMMAVGCLFSALPDIDVDIENPRLRAFQYFQASKRLCNPLDRANSDVLQTLLCQVLFLQSTANLSTCWTYIGTALRCAQRMGLHRRFDDNFNPIEKQLRKKQFWCILNVEAYLHAVLGFPRGIGGEDFDQLRPDEIDDEFVTATGVSEQPADRISEIAGANAYSRLMWIVADTVRAVYPVKGAYISTATSGPQQVSKEMIESLQERLESWSNDLPASLRHDVKFEDVTPNIYRQSRLLRYAYHHAVGLLYRSYLHYLGTQEAAYAEYRRYAEKVKATAVSTLELTESIFARDPTDFGHMFSIYACFFCGTALLYCVQREKPVGDERIRMLKYIEVAKRGLEFTSQCSFAGEKCLRILEDISERVIPEKTPRDRPFTYAGAAVQMKKEAGLSNTSMTNKEKQAAVKVLRKKASSLSLQQTTPRKSGHKKTKSVSSIKRSHPTLDASQVPEFQFTPNTAGVIPRNDIHQYNFSNAAFENNPFQTFDAFQHSFAMQDPGGSSELFRYHTQDTYQPQHGAWDTSIYDTMNLPQYDQSNSRGLQSDYDQIVSYPYSMPATGMETSNVWPAYYEQPDINNNPSPNMMTYAFTTETPHDPSIESSYQGESSSR